jgi:hypothetical protein
VAMILGLPRAPKPDDAADALAIALTAVGRWLVITDFEGYTDIRIYFSNPKSVYH